MNALSTINAHLSSPSSTPSCCKKNSQSHTQIKEVNLICRIAIGVFATYIAPLYLAIALSTGAIVGAGYAAFHHWQQQPMTGESENKPVCAQGYMDFLSGMNFPPIISNVATSVFIAAHMRHDPLFYVPFCGFFLGFRLGKESTQSACALSKRIWTTY